MEYKKYLKKIIEVGKNILGHAVSGGIVAGFYAVSQLDSNDWQVLVKGFVIGGSIGFLRGLANELENFQPRKTDARIRRKQTTKSWVRYFI